MKRISAIIAVGLVVLSLTGCGDKGANQSSSQGTSDSSITTEAIMENKDESMEDFAFNISMVQSASGISKVYIRNVTQWPIEDEINICFEPYLLSVMSDRGDGNAAITISRGDGTGSYNSLGELQYEYDALQQTLTVYIDETMNIDISGVKTYDCYCMRNGRTISYRVIYPKDILQTDTEDVDDTTDENLYSTTPSLAELLPEEFPLHKWDDEMWVREAQRSEEDYFVIMSSVYWMKYEIRYGANEVKEWDEGEEGIAFLGTSPTVNKSDWYGTPIVKKKYEVKHLYFCFWNEDGDLICETKAVGDNAILKFIYKDWNGDLEIKNDVAYANGLINSQINIEDYASDFGKGLGLVERENCTIFYSK